MPRKLSSELTPKQAKILGFIIKFIAKNRYSPSIRNICDQFEIHSTNGASEHLEAIERKGYLRRERNQARSIVVLKDPDGTPFRTPFETEVAKLLELVGDGGSSEVKKQVAKIAKMIR